MNSGVVYEPLAVVAMPARAWPSEATVSNTTGCTVCERTEGTRAAGTREHSHRVPVEQHGVAERQEAVLAAERLGVEPAPPLPHEGVDHHQQRRAWQMEVGQQQVDQLPVVPAVDEDV